MNEKIKVIIGDESKEFGCMLANSLRGRGFFAVTVTMTVCSCWKLSEVRNPMLL